MAVDLAKQKKLNLNDYKSPTIDFDSIKKDWWVSFDHKPPVVIRVGILSFV